MSDESRASVMEPDAQIARQERSQESKEAQAPTALQRDSVGRRDHTFEYVIVLVQSLFGHPIEKGYQIAEEVDNRRSGDPAHHHQGARRAEARPDPRLRQGPAARRMPRLDVCHDRAVPE